MKMGRRSNAIEHKEVKRAVAAAHADLDGGGRILLRPSGTEPVLRVMVEARDGAKARRWAATIADAVRKTS